MQGGATGSMRDGRANGGRPKPANVEEITCASPFLGWVSWLVHMHRARLLGRARHEGLTAEDAFDAVQEAFHTFLLLPQARSLVDEPEESARFLSVIVRNEARNQRRLHRLAQPHNSIDAMSNSLADDLPSADELIARAEEHVRLRGCVDRLGRVQRAVVTLRMLDEIPGEEVASTLRLSPSHVAVLLHRAKRRLRDCMAGL